VTDARVIRLTLAYDGTGFRGWAKQRDPSIRTVEGTLTELLAHVLREDVRLSVAGRTDAGVHARGQVVSFTTGSRVLPARVQAFLNGKLSPEIVIREASFAPEGFDARFSATGREYRYVIDTSEIADPFMARYVWHRPGDLSVTSMRAAARQMVGERDFTSFCRHPGEGRSTVRHLRRLSVRRRDALISVTAEADAFLHQMVRSMVGMLVRVGEGKAGPDEVTRILVARDRAGAAPVAPPQGLTLERVFYGRVTSR
jgi:tRNA pseudouridine38-40 synthase